MNWLYIIVLSTLFVAGCGKDQPQARPHPYRAVATVGMVRDIVAQVAGEHAQVHSLLGPGVDPHLYKPTRDDVARLMRADVIFYNGHMLEGKMVEVMDKLSAKKSVYAVAEGLNKSILLYPDGETGHADPHLWMDVSAWRTVVGEVARALAEFDPEHAADYQANAQKYQKELESLHEYGLKVIHSIPEQGRVLISSHDAFNYFGRAYGVKVMGVQGMNTESEAGLRRINSLVDMIVQNKIKAVFVESSVPRKSIEALIAGVRSRGGELVIGGELFTDAMGEEGAYKGTYIGMMDHNLTTVARALGGEAPKGGMNGRMSHE